MNEQPAIHVKVTYNDVTRKLTLSQSQSWEEILSTLMSRFNLSNKASEDAWAVVYCDGDGDHISLSSNVELMELLASIPCGSVLKWTLQPLGAQVSDSASRVTSAVAPGLQSPAGGSLFTELSSDDEDSYPQVARTTSAASTIVQQVPDKGKETEISVVEETEKSEDWSFLDRPSRPYHNVVEPAASAGDPDEELLSTPAILDESDPCTPELQNAPSPPLVSLHDLLSRALAQLTTTFSTTTTTLLERPDRSAQIVRALVEDVGGIVRVAVDGVRGEAERVRDEFEREVRKGRAAAEAVQAHREEESIVMNEQMPPAAQEDKEPVIPGAMPAHADMIDLTSDSTLPPLASTQPIPTLAQFDADHLFAAKRQEYQNYIAAKKLHQESLPRAANTGSSGSNTGSFKRTHTVNLSPGSNRNVTSQPAQTPLGNGFATSSSSTRSTHGPVLPATCYPSPPTQASAMPFWSMPGSFGQQGQSQFTTYAQQPRPRHQLQDQQGPSRRHSHGHSSMARALAGKLGELGINPADPRVQVAMSRVLTGTLGGPYNLEQMVQSVLEEIM